MTAQTLTDFMKSEPHAHAYGEALSRQLERVENPGDTWDFLLAASLATRDVLRHYPATWRGLPDQGESIRVRFRAEARELTGAATPTDGAPPPGRTETFDE